MKIALLGHMGRDEAAADRLVGHELHVLGQWRNPGLARKAEASGGKFYLIDSIKNVETIADIVQDIKPDMFFTNFDDSLAAGVVDVIRERVKDGNTPGILMPCPDKAAARVEWDKFYLRELIEGIDSEYNPVNFMVEKKEGVDEAIGFFESRGTGIALKPRNLTGGKGVKVMGKHLATHEEAREYALKILSTDDQSGIEIQEKLEGHEFTLQLFTDGTTLIKPPVTYDYPYREDGDEGPGTGGMGTFSMEDGLLSFVTSEDYEEAIALMRRLLVEIKRRGHSYKGVLYPTFFKTGQGLKIVEVNARGGDPELINIIDLMEDDVDFAEVLRLIALGELAEDSVRYKKLATAMLYLVSPDYGYRKGPVHDFELDLEVISDYGCHIRFAAAEHVKGKRYRTVGSSRAVGISAQGQTPWEARDKIHNAIKAGFKHPLTLKYREQVAEKEYVGGLSSSSE